MAYQPFGRGVCPHNRYRAADKGIKMRVAGNPIQHTTLWEDQTMLEIYSKLLTSRYMASKYLASRHDEKGASAVEYGLLVALIAAIIVAAVATLGQTVLDAFNDTNDGIQNGTP